MAEDDGADAQVRHRGIFKAGWVFTFAATAYSLVQMRNARASPVGAGQAGGQLSPIRSHLSCGIRAHCPFSPA
jgi:hypothetical protein